MKTSFIAPLLVAAFLVGCGQSASNLARLSVGMDKSAVVRTLGTPQSVAASGNSEIFTYTLSNDWNNVAWNQQYYVRFLNGRVVSYGS